MTDRPILFSGPMIRALLDGRKTQTRRVIKPQPPIRPELVEPFWGGPSYWAVFDGADEAFNVRINTRVDDRLYVREHWRTSGSLDSIAPRDIPRTATVFYNADDDRSVWAGKHRQAMHMPRWASRLTLIVTDVRVERLQDISEEDAIAEGIEPVTDFMPYGHHWKRYRDGGWNGYVDNPIASYASLWTEINGAGSWEANPFVAAYTFRVIKQNIDQIEKVAA